MKDAGGWGRGVVKVSGWDVESMPEMLAGKRGAAVGDSFAGLQISA